MPEYTNNQKTKIKQANYDICFIYIFLLYSSFTICLRRYSSWKVDVFAPINNYWQFQINAATYLASTRLFISSILYQLYRGIYRPLVISVVLINVAACKCGFLRVVANILDANVPEFVWLM